MTYSVFPHFILKLLQVLFGLLAGVIITTAFALISHAQSINITATVPSPLPTSSATITSVFDQEHVTISFLTISGTCGDGVYVTLDNNGSLVGTAACTNGSFDINVNLTPGANQLQAHVFNNTNNEGPLSPTVTIYFDNLPNSPLPPVETVLSLKVTSVDGIPYTQGLAYRTSSQPTIQGVAPPFSIITITYSPIGYTCKTTADSSGFWTCTLGSVLSGNTFEVAVSSTSPQGIQSNLPIFFLSVIPSILPLVTPHPGKTLTLRYSYSYKIYHVGELWHGDFAVDGGKTPYTIEIDWQDGKHSRQVVPSAGPIRFTHTYSKPGNYQPLVQVTDSAGARTLMQILIVVEDNQPASHQTSSELYPISSPILIGVAIVIAITIVAELFGAIQISKIGRPKK